MVGLDAVAVLVGPLRILCLPLTELLQLIIPRDKALLEVENLQAQSEQAWNKRDTYKEIADKCAQIRAEFSPAFKEKKETEERFSKLEGSVSELKDMIKGLVKELKG